MNYYILSLTHTNSEALMWWRPNNSGYTTILDDAGKYSKEDIQKRKSYYDNKVETVALPCNMVEEFAVKIVPSHMTLANFEKYTECKKEPIA